MEVAYKTGGDLLGSATMTDQSFQSSAGPDLPTVCRYSPQLYSSTAILRGCVVRSEADPALLTALSLPFWESNKLKKSPSTAVL